MSVTFKFSADATGVQNALADVSGQISGLTAEMSRMSWAEFAMGAQAVTGLVGQVQGALSSLMEPAMALENAGAQLGVMFGDASLGEELAASLQRMATNGVVSMQELQSAAAALVGTFTDPGEIAQWVGTFANISAGSKMTATRLAEMVARLEDMGKAEFTELANAGIPIYSKLAEVMGVSTEEVVKLGAEGKVSAEDLLAAFAALTEEGEKFHDLNAAMSSTTEGSWETLRASVEEVLAQVGTEVNNVVRPLLQSLASIIQKYKDGFAALVSYAVKFVAVWAGFRAFDFAATIYRAVVALGAMNGAASGLLGIFRAIGKVGWMLLITTAVEALSFLYDKFYGEDARAREEEARRQEEEAARKKQEAEEAARKAEAAEDAEILRHNRRLQIREKLANKDVTSSDEVRALLDEYRKLWDESRRLENARVGLPDDPNSHINYALAHGDMIADARRAIEDADRRARSKKLWEDYGKTSQQQRDADEKDRLAEFKRMSSEEQFKRIRGVFGGVDLAAGDNLEDARRILNKAMMEAAENGEEGRYNALKKRLVYLSEHEKTLEKEAAEREKNAAEAQKNAAELAAKRAATLSEEQAAEARAALVASGDTAALAAFDDAAARNRHRAELMEAGLSAQEADYYAGRRVQRDRAQADAAAVNASTPSFITSSTAAIGGGGFGIRLGDAQLEVSKKHLAVGEQVRDLVQAIGRKITGFAGIPVTA